MNLTLTRLNFFRNWSMTSKVTQGQGFSISPFYSKIKFFFNFYHIKLEVNANIIFHQIKYALRFPILCQPWLTLLWTTFVHVCKNATIWGQYLLVILKLYFIQNSLHNFMQLRLKLNFENMQYFSNQNLCNILDENFKSLKISHWGNNWILSFRAGKLNSWLDIYKID